MGKKLRVRKINTTLTKYKVPRRGSIAQKKTGWKVRGGEEKRRNTERSSAKQGTEITGHLGFGISRLEDCKLFLTWVSRQLVVQPKARKGSRTKGGVRKENKKGSVEHTTK